MGPCELCLAEAARLALLAKYSEEVGIVGFLDSLLMTGRMTERQALMMPRVGSRSVKSPSGATLYVILCGFRSLRYLMRRIEMMQILFRRGGKCQNGLRFQG